MYFSVYPTSEYYSDEDFDKKIFSDEEKDICIICWLPSEETNKIQKLTEFKEINTKCDCKPKIHSLCLEKWTKQNLSCPICRSKITLNFIQINHNNYFMYCYFFCIDKTINCLRILSYASFINLICILIYNVFYFTSHFINEQSNI